MRKAIGFDLDTKAMEVFRVIYYSAEQKMEAEYRSIIEIDRNISGDELVAITKVIESAFRNRAGTVENRSKDPFVFIFEGDEKLYGCLHLGAFDIAENNKALFNHIKSWKWLDRDEPSEDEDLKKTFLYAGIRYGWWK